MAQRITESERERRRDFGRYLKGLRKDQGLTQEKIGYALGITGGEVSLIEKGERPISDESLIRLAEKYGVLLEEMLRKKYWPQLIFLPLIYIINPEQLPKDLVEELVEGGLKEEERRELTQQIEKLLRRQSRVEQHT